ncbi:MAG TPA: serine/threonine protein phosphatase [Novosphingobium sp.]|nr:serine/threonine protein phosphatase [Novosphingobium sp.]
MPEKASPAAFSVAVICDTQNYVDHNNQREAGFPLNAREMLWDMMTHIARQAQANGGDIAFVTGLGDNWQHPSVSGPDAQHAVAGAAANPVIEQILPASPDAVRAVEMPAVRHAWEIVAQALPFSVVPGNHDHDYLWTDPARPPLVTEFAGSVRDIVHRIGGLHVGELDNWTQVFGSGTAMFRDRPWYVSAFRDGANSAQVFAAGGYRFLHLGLEMCPDDAVIAWAQSVIDAHPGLPTLLSIHEFINEAAERRSIEALDLTRIDPERNSPQALWDKLVRPNDQILITLNGHFHGINQRIDDNHHGHKVYQFLVNYQSRRQALKEAVPDAKVLDGLGDGWIRLLTFDLAGDAPRLRLRAYSTHYKAFASDLPHYAQWYGHEHPELTPAAFLALDEAEILLDDFRERFGPPGGAALPGAALLAAE